MFLEKVKIGHPHPASELGTCGFFRGRKTTLEAKKAQVFSSAKHAHCTNKLKMYNAHAMHIMDAQFAHA